MPNLEWALFAEDTSTRSEGESPCDGDTHCIALLGSTRFPRALDNARKLHVTQTQGVEYFLARTAAKTPEDSSPIGDRLPLHGTLTEARAAEGFES